MGETEKLSLFDSTREEYGTIDTTGDIFKRWVKIPHFLVDECKMQFSQDGVSVTTRDPANVAMLDTTIHAHAFESYKMNDVKIGIPLRDFVQAIRRARVGSEDKLELTVSDNDIRSTITREYDGTRMSFNDICRTMDPDSIRGEPDVPNLDLDHEVEMSAKAFSEGIDHLSEFKKTYAHVHGVNGRFALTSGTDRSEVVFENVSTDCENRGGSLMSMDYLTDFIGMVKKSKAETVRIRFDDEFPVKVHFNRLNDDGEEIYSMTYMQAPRIQSE